MIAAIVFPTDSIESTRTFTKTARHASLDVDHSQLSNSFHLFSAGGLRPRLVIDTAFAVEMRNIKHACELTRFRDDLT